MDTFGLEGDHWDSIFSEEEKIVFEKLLLNGHILLSNRQGGCARYIRYDRCRFITHMVDYELNKNRITLSIPGTNYSFGLLDSNASGKQVVDLLNLAMENLNISKRYIFVKESENDVYVRDQS